MQKKYKIYVKHDDISINPRKDFDTLGTLYASHRNYSLSDNNAENIDVENFKGVVLPVYMYDHGSVSVSTTPYSCPWDSGQLGIIYCSKERIQKEFDWNRLTPKRREQIKKILIDEIKLLDDYLSGNVWGYVLVEVSDTGEEEEKDSCWGFFGDYGFKNHSLNDVFGVNEDEVEFINP